jgi:Na+/proline symporter
MMAGELSFWDWLIISLYLIFTMGVGVYFSKRASSSTQEYFLGGRTLPWWLVGTSMIATTFASDTPLAITELVRKYGLWRNWFWWNAALTHLMCVFLFARLWRRSEVVTDNELIELRYSGKPAAVLRGFKAIYFGIFYNFIVMGWVINAIASVIGVMVGVSQGWEQSILVWTCSAIALTYAVMSGYWGVVVTDFIQFIIAIAGSIFLAVISFSQLGGFSGIQEKILPSQPAMGQGTFSFFPPMSLELESPFISMLIFLSVMWWANHYADGGGYIIQRIASCKDEKNSVLATLFFAFTNMIRGWPWIMVALASLVFFPTLAQDKDAYPLVMRYCLGVGMKGLLVASFLAAFMSTIDTHLNWGASYLLNDFYRRFIKKNASEAHYVRATKLMVIGLMVGGAITAFGIDRISAAWELTAEMGAGIGAVLILRWFWWRINAVSEIVALTSSLLLAMFFLLGKYLWPQATILGFEFATLPFHIKTLIIVPVSLVCWLTATFLTEPESQDVLNRFYLKVCPGGWWRGIDTSLINPEKRVLNARFVINWFSGIVLIFGTTLGLGYAIFQSYIKSLLCIMMAVMSGVVIMFTIKKFKSL